MLIFFCVFVYEAKDWRMQARLYPLAIGIPMLIFAIVQVILDLKGVKAKQSSDGAPMDFQFQQTDVSPEDVAANEPSRCSAGCSGFLRMIWLVGYVIAIPLMVFGLSQIPVGRDAG